jgi:hypothetical protein
MEIKHLKCHYYLSLHIIINMTDTIWKSYYFHPSMRYSYIANLATIISHSTVLSRILINLSVGTPLYITIIFKTNNYISRTSYTLMLLLFNYSRAGWTMLSARIIYIRIIIIYC